jgi:hypothetical protein
MSYWVQVLDDLELSEVQEVSVLEFCCEVSSMPYNRRTSRSLRDIIRQGKNSQKIIITTTTSVVDADPPDPHVFWPPDPDALVKGMDPGLDPSIIKQ